MNIENFSLSEYLQENLSGEDADNYYIDVFQELEDLHNNESRRLSFSIPDDLKKLKSITPSALIPELNPFTPRIQINIPEDNTDTIFSLDGFNDIVESNPPSPKQLQNSIDFPIEHLLEFSNTDNTQYKIPPRMAYDARKIWRYAKISKIAQIREIEPKLLDWAFTYANLKITNNKIQNIIWKTHSKCICSSKWTTFVKWMLCASISHL